MRPKQIASSRYKSQGKVRHGVKRTPGPILGKINRTKIFYPAII